MEQRRLQFTKDNNNEGTASRSISVVITHAAHVLRMLSNFHSPSFYRLKVNVSNCFLSVLWGGVAASRYGSWSDDASGSVRGIASGVVTPST